MRRPAAAHEEHVAELARPADPEAILNAIKEGE